jgi:hypothetical protein
MNAISVPSQACTLRVIGKDLRLSFSSVLLTPAAREIDLDIWRVTIQAEHEGVQSDPVVVTHKTGMGHRAQLDGESLAKAPDPADVLARIASDLSLYTQMPSATGAAIDFLFKEGYAAWPSECLDLRNQLVMTANKVLQLLSGTDIPLSMFTVCISATCALHGPLNPRRG